jgi:hypothetical protein
MQHDRSTLMKGGLSSMVGMAWLQPLRAAIERAATEYRSKLKITGMPTMTTTS